MGVFFFFSFFSRLFFSPLRCRSPFLGRPYHSDQFHFCAPRLRGLVGAARIASSHYCCKVRIRFSPSRFACLCPFDRDHHFFWVRSRLARRFKVILFTWATSPFPVSVFLALLTELEVASFLVLYNVSFSYTASAALQSCAPDDTFDRIILVNVAGSDLLFRSASQPPSYPVNVVRCLLSKVK